jgi:uncharacterized protein (DUF1697 family)
MRWLALLRGVNVGGKRKLPMRALEGAFMLTGATVVATYIQSGNVVFESDRPAEACAEAAEAVEEKFGFRPVVIHRSAAGWRTMIAKNPFIAAGPGRKPSCRVSREGACAGCFVRPRSQGFPARRVRARGR